MGRERHLDGLVIEPLRMIVHFFRDQRLRYNPKAWLRFSKQISTLAKGSHRYYLFAR